jgi:hypothetical protein
MRRWRRTSEAAVCPGQPLPSLSPPFETAARSAVIRVAVSEDRDPERRLHDGAEAPAHGPGVSVNLKAEPGWATGAPDSDGCAGGGAGERRAGVQGPSRATGLTFCSESSRKRGGTKHPSGSAPLRERDSDGHTAGKPPRSSSPTRTRSHRHPVLPGCHGHTPRRHRDCIPNPTRSPKPQAHWQGRQGPAPRASGPGSGPSLRGSLSLSSSRLLAFSLSL